MSMRGPPVETGDSRNGTSSKARLTDHGEIEVPRDRAGMFEPVMVAKGRTRFDGFDEMGSVR
jgi:putative transposase